MAFIFAPRLKKKYHGILGTQFVTIHANVPAFINNLGAHDKSKMLKIGPNFFQH
jgi:hypothetical protein